MQFDREVDVLIVGTGNGALTSAVCLHQMGVQDLLVIEKSELIGGSSSRSGGGVWVPNNRYAKAAGVQDSREDALLYLKNTIPPEDVPQDLQTTYIDMGPKMIDFLHTHSRVRYWSLEHYPDYYTNLPGSRTGHRSMEPEPVMRDVVGDDWKFVRDTHPMISMFGRIFLTQVEAHDISTKAKGWVGSLTKLLAGYYLDFPWIFKHKTSRRMTCGGAGVMRLYWSCKERHIPIERNTSLQELIKNEAGRVVGAIISKNGNRERIGCRKAVILAAGGFEHNQQMREQYLPAPTNSKWSAGCESNTGDAIRAGIAAGAATRFLGGDGEGRGVGAWWCTTTQAPDDKIPRLVIIDKSMPGSCVVNMAGKRIGNESENYMAYARHLFKTHNKPDSHVPSYMVFDARFRKEYMVAGLMTSQMRPDSKLPQSYWDSKYLVKADTIAELAEKAGIDAPGLQATVSAMNSYAATGVDLAFDRGGSEYDRYYGDTKIKPNPCLAPIVQDPFYALRVDQGDFGTNGGLEITTDAQVRSKDGGVIDGLYAIGNTAAAILSTYPGPGCTLGPAMTYGYQAAKHISGYQDAT